MARKLKNEVVIRDADGNVTTQQKNYSVKTDSENFFMTFLDSLQGLFRIKNATDQRVLCKMNSISEFNTGRVIVTQELRNEMLRDLEIDNQVLSNSLKRLRGAGMISGTRGIYEINPMIFWKGTTNERKRLLNENGLEIRIKFSCNEDVGEENPMLVGSKEFN